MKTVKGDHSGSFASEKAPTRDSVDLMESGMLSTTFLILVMESKCAFFQDRALSFGKRIQRRPGSVVYSHFPLTVCLCGKEIERNSWALYSNPGFLRDRFIDMAR